jgi:glycosyltransferase involved in cell wall biosynthesis
MVLRDTVADRALRAPAAVHARTPVTAIILTYNEASNIAACLAGLEDVDDVAILDSGSTDETLALARKARPDVRVYTRAFTDFGDQRNWAIDNCEARHEWILFVDADEFCTPELIREVGDLVAAPGAYVGGFIAGRNMFLGQWLKHSTLYPSYQLRLFKRSEVRFRREGHGQREVTDGPLVHLKGWWRHEGFSKGLHQWIARHNDYSSNEIELIQRLKREPLVIEEFTSPDPVVRRRALKRIAAKTPVRPVVRFCYTYFWRRGFLDGRAGLIFCLLRLAHDIHIVAKIAEEEAAARAAAGRRD